ncbi:hypothetical protein [Bradyrhizobium sp. RT6a]|uniref:hypothetical protein n=1 Tax=unclassified Bradyrhizobium TaxID=2631580 RepID=UPI003394DAE5
MPDRLKPIYLGRAFPKLDRMTVYKQFGPLPSCRLVLHFEVNSKRDVTVIADDIDAKPSHNPAQKLRLIPKLELI